MSDRFSHWAIRLERHQTPLYLLSMLCAALYAWWRPSGGTTVLWLNPAMAGMLFVTFLQLPLDDVLRALRQRRFLLALLVTNFMVVPLLVAALVRLWPMEALVATGVAIVLLCPCVDYVVAFSHQGSADSRLLLATTPLLLLVQMLALPLWLPVVVPQPLAITLDITPFLQAFSVLMALPLLLACWVQRCANRYRAVARLAAGLALCPVPAMALVLALIVAFVVPQLAQAGAAAAQALPVYVVFALTAPALGWLMARCFALAAPAGRALVFSAATRNALIILPLALALPNALPVIPAVVVTQTLVELLAELVYIRCVPRWRFIHR